MALTTKYSYPLPNNGDKYMFSREELILLLDSTYNKGFVDGVQTVIAPETTFAVADYATFIPDSCKACSNHPSNGGSGFCNCTLGLNTVG